MDPGLKQKLIGCKKGDAVELYFITFGFASKAKFEVAGVESFRFDERAYRTLVCLRDGTEELRLGNRYIHKRLRCKSFEVGNGTFHEITIYEDTTILHGGTTVDQEVLLIDPDSEGADEMVEKVKAEKAVSLEKIASFNAPFDASCKLVLDKLSHMKNIKEILEQEISDAQRELDAKVAEKEKHCNSVNRVFARAVEDARIQYIEKTSAKRLRKWISDV